MQGAYDISRKAPFVIVNGSPRSDVNVKAGYAVADRTALVEVNYKDKEARRNSYVPVVRVSVCGVFGAPRGWCCGVSKAQQTVPHKLMQKSFLV